MLLEIRKWNLKFRLFKYLSDSTQAFWNNGLAASGPFALTNLIDEPFDWSFPSAHLLWKSSLVSWVNPHLFETIIFCLPGNLFLALLKASKAGFTCCLSNLTEYKIDPILTLATFPYDFPKACLIPVWSLSAPAHDNILFILTTCHGWTLHLKWKLSFPTCLVKYLLQAIRAASKASEEICSTSSDTMWTEYGN